MSYHSSIFGWSYPPGCSGPPDDDTPPCDVCGEFVDDCICPECPQCGRQGDPDCYTDWQLPRERPLHPTHGLVRTLAQCVGAARLEESYRQQAAADRAEAEYWADPQRKVEAAEFDALMAEEQRLRGRE